MPEYLRRSARKPAREGLDLAGRWEGPDRGLIWCWERGREKQTEVPELAVRARDGELVSLVWKKGTLRYLAMWQGLRGDDLDLALDGETPVTCTKTKKTVIFSWASPPDDEEGEELGE
jgi:hypothetical protein